ncbi:hypothetical protein [Yersinia bercovieri]|uniref:hypothetical protein n=1 Tax=Yersinia bercovieri TaxID=634 RepID=UPI0005E57BF3|nr:hypothetical protein [Yersinia bercovieri]CFQ29779.1 Uncharacterised protein [Yersinia bercovieri]
MTNTHLSDHPELPDSRLDAAFPPPVLRESAGEPFSLANSARKQPSMSIFFPMQE